MEIFNIEFLQNAIIAGLLGSITFGILGPIVVVKRISSITGAISHCILGGIGASLFLQGNYGIMWFNPVLGAVCAAIISALIIGLINIYANEREDTIISTVWVLGMSIGILFINYTPGYNNIMNYLFGNILMISELDIQYLIIVNIVIITLCVLFYNKILAVCFDSEFAMLRGIKTQVYHLALLVIISVSIVFLIRIVGIIMVIAMLTIPTAIAGEFISKLWKIIIASIILCVIYIIGGLILSYHLDLPAGALIIVLFSISYLLSLSIKPIFKKRKLL